MMRSKLLTVLLMITFVLAGFSAPQAALAAPTAVFVNELHYDNAGSDQGEGIEIAGPAGTDLNGWSVVFYNGSTGLTYNTLNLSGIMPSQEAGMGTLYFPQAGIQNGSPDGFALVDTSNAVVQFLSYEGTFIASGGPADGMLSTDIGVSQSSSNPIGYSLQLGGTGLSYEDFTWQASSPETFGSVNTNQTFLSGGNAPIVPTCGGPLTLIEGEGGSRDFSATDTDGIVTNAYLPIPGPELTVTAFGDDSVYWTLENVVPAAEIGGTLIGTVAFTDTVPVGNYLVTVGFSNEDAVPQTAECSFDVTVLDYVPIFEIQGTGHLSPYDGQRVATDGIVTAVAFDGFFVQDPYGDGDVNTSDGMWVFMGNYCNGCPDVGDHVQLIDYVDEFIPGGWETGNLSTTDMAFPAISLLSTGNTLPDPVVIGRNGRISPAVDVISDSELPVNLQNVPGMFNPDVDGIDFYESLEGMLVTVEDAVAVSAVRRFGSFSSELFTLPNNGHPQVIEPNNIRTDRGGINLAADADGYGDLNPERVQIQFDASDSTIGTLYPGSVPEINVGDRLGDVTGVVGYEFGNFEVRAVQEISIAPAGITPETTSLFGTQKHVTVASYNVLNLSPLPEDDNQRAKLAYQIVNNMGSPDVVALQEIQDNTGDIDDGTTDATLTLQALVDAISAAGGPAYAFFDVAPVDGSSGGIPGGNIRNAFLYNPGRVSLESFVSLTPDVLLAAGVSNPNAFTDTRNPLAGTFMFDGKPFTVINNHLSSRSGSTPIFGGPQPFFQAAEAEREAQVGTLNDYVDFLLGNDKDARVIVLGDFNTFEFTDDLTEILPGTLDGKAVMKSLLNEVIDDNRYTYIFDGNSQVLDHMFATRSLLEGAEFDIVHVNVDFARLGYSTTASDHEPLVGRFDLSAK